MSNYYVSNLGSDNNIGSISTPWATLSKVNGYNLIAGDTVSFKRGHSWRGNLYPKSGVTYTAYSQGNKPFLIESQSKNNTSDWLDEGGNIWSNIAPNVTGNEILSNTTFDVDTTGWHLYKQSGVVAALARDTDVYDSSPASLRVDCTTNNTSINGIQLYTNAFSITCDTYYQLSFKAKCTIPFTLNAVSFMKEESPYSNYYRFGINYSNISITSDWVIYTIIWKSSVTASDARLTWVLGNCLPDGSSFYLDSLSLKALDNVPFINDIGNLIFNNQESYGIKVWNEVDLDTQGKFWYDLDNHIVKVYSIGNPASIYSSIECAITEDIISMTELNNITIDNIETKYGGADGIHCFSCSDITVTNCYMHHVGGGDGYQDGIHQIRYGNGLTFTRNSHDCLVDNCHADNCYDTGLTNQLSIGLQYNITYSNNFISNCAYSFEFFNSLTTTTVHDIIFENNICVNAGKEWSASQRPIDVGYQGSQIRLSNYIDVSNFIIRNNIFSYATYQILSLKGDTEKLSQIQFSDNKYYQSSSDCFLNWLDNDTYLATQENFEWYRGNFNNDNNSELSNIIEYKRRKDMTAEEIITDRTNRINAAKLQWAT